MKRAGRGAANTGRLYITTLYKRIAMQTLCSDIPLPQQHGVTFRHIPGFPGYAAGDDGSIWTIRSKGGGRYLGSEWRRRAARRHKSGHLTIQIADSSCVKRHFYVHRLILITFAGDPPAGCEACHNNGVPDDNRLANLRWDTRSENIKDSYRHRCCDLFS